MEILFAVSNVVSTCVVFALILFPGTPATQRMIKTPWVCAPWLVLTAYFIAKQVVPFLTFDYWPTLQGLMDFTSHPDRASVAWFHIISADIFFVRWIFLDNASSPKMGRVGMSIVLTITLFEGAIGLLLYLTYAELIGCSRRRGLRQTNKTTATQPQNATPAITT
jgi:hypothetical protein